VEIRSVTAVQGERIQQAPTFEPPQNVTIEKEVHNRYIVNVDNRTYIENNDYDRISHRAEDVYYERLPQDNYRQVVVRPNGVRVVTIRNRYGDILQRSRIRDGQETVLIYAPDYDRDQRDLFYQPVDLPPIRLTEPVDEYILDAEDAAPEQYVTFLEKPPIEPIEQVYTLDQVRYSARLRDIMPRIDLDTITFATGSAVIEQSQEQSLEALANAINDILQDDPGQVFLVEGHTDAVGSDQSNLILSDQRAESVAAALTQDFDVPPENLVTQGYGEQYLKIETEGPSRENRRVAIRRITPLIRPTAQR
jgi:outer membrane protein OmpA-like peptidoglycan-associated protein